MASTKPAQRAITFIVNGQLQATEARRSGPDTNADANANADASEPLVIASVRVAATRSGSEKLRIQALTDRDVVRLQIEGGPQLTLHPETARDLLMGQSARKRSRSAAAASSNTSDDDEVEVQAELGWQGLAGTAPRHSRGLIGKVILAAIEIVRFGKFDGAAADVAAEVFMNKVDGQVKAGVYSLPAQGELTKLKDQPQRRLSQVPPAPDGRETLVLVHGTFVETSSTFGKLWSEHPGVVAQLFAHYGDRVYALDHPTLGASPVANALTLVQALPNGTRLHLLTHSRGGLVAEVLARLCGQRKLAAHDLALFPAPAYAKQRKELEDLLAAIIAKDIHVERVLRVACPARGTLLASRRLDAYLSVLTWALTASGALIASEVTGFLAAVAERRTDPTNLPGLEAMMPGSALVRWLNRPEARLPGDLRVIAGDLKGEDLFSWVKTLLSDAFYWTDNDIVVHTASMYGGSPRERGAHFVLDQSGSASHFSYFKNSLSVDAVLVGLTQSNPAGYQAIGPLSWAGDTSDGVRSARASRGDAAPSAPVAHQPGLIFIPGLLGSNLEVDGKRVWLGLRMLGGFDQLRYSADNNDKVKPDGAISLIYSKLIEHLSKSHDVQVFDFDWRRPLEEEARRLAVEVERQLDARVASDQPVRVLVHSMGGVLARTMQLEKPATWQRLMAHPGARLVMLGTPNGGSWAPMQALTGDDTFSNMLTAVGAPFQDQEARQIMAEMPGFLQLQAQITDSSLGLDQEATWRRLAAQDKELLQSMSWWHRNWMKSDGADTSAAVYDWGIPPQVVLDQAKALRQRLDVQLKALKSDFQSGKVLMVVGKAKFTPDGYEVSPDEGFTYRNAVDGGDGRVPLPMALLPGVATWTLDVDHGALPSAQHAFAAFEELLVQGKTEILPSLPQGTRSAATGAEVAKLEHVLSRPARSRRSARPGSSEEWMLSAPEVADDSRPAAAIGKALQVKVLNGNLMFIRTPLFIGHYRSLSLTGTERVVDDLIGRTMSTALSLNTGYYPEAPGTNQVFVNTVADPSVPSGQRQPPAAVVVGLGEEGKLTESVLAATVRQAVLAWLQRKAEERALDSSTADVEVAATLIGSGGFGISAGAASRAVAQGVADANLRVAQANQRARGPAWPLVSCLTLVELYLDRASEAWRELKALELSSQNRFDVCKHVQSGGGCLRRPLDAGYRGADYDFVRVNSHDNGLIEFSMDSQRARNDLRENSTQASLVRELVQTASSDSNTDAQLGRTLFQLLVPPSIEPYLSGSSRIVLELDLKSAEIPWELLDPPVNERNKTNNQPWAVRSRMLRKMRLKDEVEPGRVDAIADDSVLVIGEPQVDTSKYCDLPGALQETKEVEKLLQAALGHHCTIKALYKQGARPIINALLERPWRILHLAGHGEASAKGGVVLSGHTFLGANEIKAMRTVPELVFVNCCHLASLQGPDGKPRAFHTGAFAAGVAEALIRIGVRCVVAAGWAVDDLAAQAFALKFYERVIQHGDNFASAVGEAREAARSLGGNTWAAYQCYGDPEWRLRAGTGDAQAPRRSLGDEYAGIASPLGLALALETLAVGSEWEHRRREGQLARIGHLEGQFGKQWAGIGAVAEAFGVAYAAAGAFEEAIAWFKKALLCADSSASIKVHEQLGKLMARGAYERLSGLEGRHKKADIDTALQQATEGWKLLKGLTQQATSERWSLVGSACKRLALIQSLAGNTQQESAWLEEMDGAYQQAERQASEHHMAQWFYPALNRLATRVRRWQLQADASTRPTEEDFLKVERSMKAQSQTSPDFWSEAGPIELATYRQLLKDPQLAMLAEVPDLYYKLHSRAPAPQHWRTVADQLEFAAGPTIKAHPRGALAQLLKQVQGYGLKAS